jgi:hypothetical protein
VQGIFAFFIRVWVGKIIKGKKYFAQHGEKTSA